MDRTARSTPWAPSWPSTRSIIGTPATGRSCFGMVVVSGRSRVPSPPTRTTACTSALGGLLDGRGRGAAATVHRRGGRWRQLDRRRGRRDGAVLAEVRLLVLHRADDRGRWLRRGHAVGDEPDRDELTVREADLRGVRREERGRGDADPGPHRELDVADLAVVLRALRADLPGDVARLVPLRADGDDELGLRRGEPGVAL